MPDFRNSLFPFDAMPDRTPEEACATGYKNWRPFKEAVMGLNSMEAASAASQISIFMSTQLAGLTARLVKTQNVPDLLNNFALALVENERIEPRVNPLKVKHVVDMVLNSPFAGLTVISDKMASRIEFRTEALSMPKDAGGIYNKAFADATVGSGLGFNWACFKLRHAFQAPNASLLRQEEALDLFEGVSDMPDLVIDTLGDAGLDTAIKMERHLAIVQKLPVYAV